MFEQRFRDREEAGKQLAKKLGRFRGTGAVVWALARGGVEVGYYVAQELGLPLEVLVVRKLGAPGNPELALGAVSEGGGVVWDEEQVAGLAVDEAYRQEVEKRERQEVERRVKKYKGGWRGREMRGRTALIVDDGLATGMTALAAVAAMREAGAKRVVVAVPVGARQTVEELKKIADEVMCAVIPENLWAVGNWYENFSEVDDEKVLRLLNSGVKFKE